MHTVFQHDAGPIYDFVNKASSIQTKRQRQWTYTRKTRKELQLFSTTQKISINNKFNRDSNFIDQNLIPNNQLHTISLTFLNTKFSL